MATSPRVKPNSLTPNFIVCSELDALASSSSISTTTYADAEKDALTLLGNDCTIDSSVCSPARDLQNRLHAHFIESESAQASGGRAPLIYGIAFACISSFILWTGIFSLKELLFG